MISSLTDVLFPTMRTYVSQVIVLMFRFWPTTIPFVFYACNRIYKIIRKIR